MENMKSLVEKAKMFENNIITTDKEIRVLQEELSVNAQRYIYELLDKLENKSINLEHTNEVTYIIQDLSYIDEVYIGDDNCVYVKYRLVNDVEEGINEPFEEYILDIETTGIRDIFYTIVQELKRKNN